MTGNDDGFVVRPDTCEYDVLRFFVQNRGQQIWPVRVASALDIDVTKATTILEQLTEESPLKHDGTCYYVESTVGERLKHRLASVDAAADLHETAPEDAYAHTDWEEQVTPLDRS